MSMRDYAVDDYGLVLNKEMIDIIASKVFDDFTSGDDERLEYKLYEEDICEYVGEFTGETQELEDDGSYTWYGNREYYNGDILAYVPLYNYPTLFKKAYNNMDEIVSEFKDKLGEYLPEDFDYRSRIRHICGTYYG